MIFYDIRQLSLAVFTVNFSRQKMTVSWVSEHREVTPLLGAVTVFA